jgi:hypothetical protein
MMLEKVGGGRARLVLAAAATLLLGGCVTAAAGATDALFRPGVDLPTRFVTTDGMAAEDGCRTTMLDPRDQTRLQLARSWLEGSTWRGDYEVPVGRYGVRDGELLRLDCASGEPFGIVRGS